jgi:hypothetical protein
VEPSCGTPDWEDNDGEVSTEKENTLARVLDLDRVQVHVELGSEIRVQDTVDVLEVGAASVLVKAVRLRVGSVVMTTASGLDGVLGEHATSVTSHHLR